MTFVECLRVQTKCCLLSIIGGIAGYLVALHFGWNTFPPSLPHPWSTLGILGGAILLGAVVRYCNLGLPIFKD
jgi:hypothetical protein